MTGPLLAIDAATAHGGVALDRDGVLLAEIAISNTARHSELLLPAVEFALRAGGITRAELCGIVVGAGPGSFTGVRIAAATARGIAAALEIPLLAYSSLMALAASAARANEPVCGMFDARRGEVYAACYSFADDGITTVLAPVAAAVDDVVRMLDGCDAVFAGDGAAAYASRLPRAPLPVALVQPRASGLLWLARRYPQDGAVERAASFEPAYIRDTGAVRGLSV
ncbi:MAG: tRNA (adenosine(37)-N6)-threonylcarbamoyltransferase complex dimerization subunit type 1 TsaB [Longimicrobiales bacterium]